jgi:SnoaL-like domain
MTTTNAALHHQAKDDVAQRGNRLSAHHKAIARRFLKCVSRHDIDGILALIAPTWTMSGGPPGLPPGEPGIRTLFASFGRIQQHWDISEMVAEGDAVVVRGTCTVEQDSILGIDARGRQQVFTATFTHHLVGGLIVRTHRNADDLGRLLQLGATFQQSRGEPDAA